MPKALFRANLFTQREESVVMDYIEHWIDAKAKLKEVHDLMLDKAYDDAVNIATEVIASLRMAQAAIKVMQEQDHALHQVPPSL